jgi:hypothetical protein
VRTRNAYAKSPRSRSIAATTVPMLMKKRKSRSSATANTRHARWIDAICATDDLVQPHRCDTSSCRLFCVTSRVGIVYSLPFLVFFISTPSLVQPTRFREFANSRKNCDALPATLKCFDELTSGARLAFTELSPEKDKSPGARTSWIECWWLSSTAKLKHTKA